jgi:hypothetical protein
LLRHLPLGHLDQIEPAALVELIDQFLAHQEQALVDVTRHVGRERTDLERRDPRHAVVVDPDVVEVVKEKRFEAAVPVQTGETIDDVDRLVAVTSFQAEIAIELTQGVSGQRIVVHRVGVILRPRQAGAREQRPQRARLGVIGPAHDES